jgi:hypothetical protein
LNLLNKKNNNYYFTTFAEAQDQEHKRNGFTNKLDYFYLNSYAFENLVDMLA